MINRQWHGKVERLVASDVDGNDVTLYIRDNSVVKKEPFKIIDVTGSKDGARSEIHLHRIFPSGICETEIARLAERPVDIRMAFCRAHCLMPSIKTSPGVIIRSTKNTVLDFCARIPAF